MSQRKLWYAVVSAIGLIWCLHMPAQVHAKDASPHVSHDTQKPFYTFIQESDSRDTEKQDGVGDG